MDYFHCASCECIFCLEEHILPPSLERKEYLRHNNSLACDGYVKMFDDFIDECVLPFHPAIETALDFGSGPEPVLATLLERRGFNVDIYDVFFAPETIFKTKRYDLITATEVFEHLSQPVETLRTLASCLAKNGIIVVMTLFHPRNDAVFLDWWYRRDPTHITFFTPKTFEIMARMVGLEVVDGGKRHCVMKTRI
jgi:hypothetical protein